MDTTKSGFLNDRRYARLKLLINLTVALILSLIVGGIAVPVIVKVREAEKRTQCINNLKMIGQDFPGCAARPLALGSCPYRA
jgi:hypothetical protein